MNDDTLLYRQIRPEHVQNGRVSSLAFRPMLKDEQKLSVYDGDRLSPEEAYFHFTEELNGSSLGVLAVNVKECKDEELSVEEDYSTHPYHLLIDFSNKQGNQIRKAAEHLRDRAVVRDWLYLKI